MSKMRPSIEPKNQLNKVGRLAVTLFMAILFWLGYRYIHHLNAPPPDIPPEKRAQLVKSESHRYRVEDPLLEIKLSRDRERSREVERIQMLLDRVTLSGEVRKEAERELWRLTRATAKENELESLLKANGFTNTLATIHPQLVTIIIADKILPEQVKLVGQLAAEATSCPQDRIRIVRKDQ
jgi:hypothetical protein